MPLHPSLRDLVERIGKLRLPRDSEADLSAGLTHRTPGMSPKKAHEVDRLSNLIDKTYAAIDETPIRLIVDVGAGQGYLSHKLAEHASTRVLALDGDEGQTEGATLRGKGFSHAERQRARTSKQDESVSDDHDERPTPVTHRTLFITSDSLLHAVDEWVAGLELDPEHAPHSVLVTGLHACGSLTPAVLRCFVNLCIQARSEQATSDGMKWTPGALVLVGCCYNLMRNQDDFPLSHITCNTHPNAKIDLTQNHLQLAAQCPAQWTRSQSEMERASLARRKIVWRALLARLLHAKSGEKDIPETTDEPPTRLGRLPDRAYTSWDLFVQIACSKMGVTPALGTAPPEPSATNGQPKPGPGTEILAFQLEILHILRALIGPVIESLIIVDRVLYLAEQLVFSGGPPTFQVRAMNVFDQLSSGSARNIALVVEPVVDPIVNDR